LGLASSRGIQFYLFTAMLVFVVYRRGLLKIGSDMLRFVLRVGVASAAMTLVSWLSFYSLRRAFDSGNTPLRLSIIVILLAVSGGAFLGMARLLKLTEADLIVKAGLEMLSLPQSASGGTADPGC
jgi:peptidoglycan biosynthesis protein MviN/MurJ (putative lipid II flippase)